MKIKQQKVTIRDLVLGYSDTEKGVYGYGGRLNIRPSYQREFVYPDKKRNKVIDSVLRGLPLNVFYWVDTKNGKYELLDGQQRTLSICQFADNRFSIEYQGYETYFNTSAAIRDQFLNYELQVYICDGTDKEKLDWFETINIAAMPLKKQEIRNAIYSGSWVIDAKKYFSKPKNPVQALYGWYISGSADRQEILEKAIDWISKGKIEDYMATNQHNASAYELYNEFCSIMDWARYLFPKQRKELQTVNWGELFYNYAHKKLDPATLEIQIQQLLDNDEVEAKSGIYPYLITGKEKYLNLRTFKDSIKIAMFEKQQGVCKKCNKICKDITEMEADHIKPWHRGGKTVKENCQMLCRDCNREKSGK